MRFILKPCAKSGRYDVERANLEAVLDDNSKG